MLSEGRGNTLRRSNNRIRYAPPSRSPTSTAIDICRANSDVPKLPFPATDRRRAAVTFAPLPTSCDEHQSKDTKLKQRRRHRATVTPTVSCAGFRRDYELGERLRSPSHKIDITQPTTTSEENTNMGSLLQKHDFAFIKRSDGSYTYAILACIDKDGERMTFVLDNYGSTKVVRKRNWEKLVCLVSV